MSYLAVGGGEFWALCPSCKEIHVEAGVTCQCGHTQEIGPKDAVVAARELTISDQYPADVFDLFLARGPGYVYRHQNSTLHWKPALVVDSDPDYFNSPFVVEVWEYRP